MKKRKREALQGILCVLPVVIIVLLIKGYPMVDTVIKSFTKWDGLSEPVFIGWKNYLYILKNDEFKVALQNNFLFLLHIPVKIFIALVFALAIYERNPGYRFFRSVAYIPQVISMTIIGYLFYILFSYNGPVNTLLSNIGLENLTRDWFGTRGSAIFVVSIALTWHGIGYLALLILGGLSSIPETVFEAARLDGANYWQRLFQIILPLLARTMEYVLIVNITWAFTGLFSIIHSMTGGGPGYDTSTLDYLIYNKAFGSGTQMGLASAMAVILVLIVLVITILQLRASDKREDW